MCPLHIVLVGSVFLAAHPASSGSPSRGIQFGDLLVKNETASYTQEELERFVERIQRKAFTPEALRPSHCSTPLVLENNGTNRVDEADDVDDWMCSVSDRCYAPGYIIEHVLLGSNRTNGTANKRASYGSEDLQQLCPSLLAQTLIGKCKRSFAMHDSANNKPKKFEVWWYGFLLVTAISACSIVGAVFLPMISMNFYEGFMTMLIGLAMGSLSASALFHLLPQAFKAHEYYGSVDYLFASLAAICGIYGFLMMESALKALLEWRRRNNRSNTNSDRDGEGDFHFVPSERRSSSGSIEIPAHLKPIREDDDHEAQQGDCNGGNAQLACLGDIDVKEILRSQEQAIKASFGHPESRPVRSEKRKRISCMGRKNLNARGEKKTISTVAWMVIVGDGFHNFIDGVSVGAAFSESILIGLSVSIAVICEEFPHELGDLAVLLNSGMSLKQALLYNFVSALFCYLGLVLGILLGDLTESASAIFGVAGGVFLYIALSDMVPEMNETSEKAAKEGFRSWLKVVTLQSIGFGLGVVSLFFLAFYQDVMDLSRAAQ